MSILSVDNISPIGSGTSVTVNSAATLVVNNVNSSGVTTLGSGGSGRADLQYAGATKLQTTGVGIAVDGKTDTNYLDVNIMANVMKMEVTGISTFAAGVNVSGGQIDVGSNIKLGNAGVVTATRFVGETNGLVNVKTYGAVGDGTTDDRAAIQSAINSAKTVFFPAGTYRVGAALTVWDSYSALIGHESLPTIKVVGTGYSGPAVSVQSAGDNINEFSRIENIKFLFDKNSGGPATYSSTPNETNCGVSINGSLAPTASATNRVLRFKMENCRVLGFSNAINLKETTNTLLKRVIIEHNTDESSTTLSSSNIYCGVNFDGTPGQVGGISPQASVELHQVIFNGSGAPTNTTSMGFRVTGQDPRDIFFEGCETAHGNYGWFIDPSDDDYNIDIHINRPIVDAVDTTGIYVKDWNGYGALTINGGYVVKDANNTGSGIWVENSRGVNITGGIQVLGVSLNNVANDDGIRIKNSKICSVSSSTIMNCRYGISLEDSSNCSVTGNIVGAEIGAFTGGTNPVLSDAIRLFGNSDNNTITGNTIKGASSSYKYSNGILINASTCEENMVSSNVIDDSTVTIRLNDAGVRTNIFDRGKIGISTTSGGKLLVGGGTGSAIEFNDSNTKLDIPAANTLAAYTSGNERVRIKADGTLVFNNTINSIHTSSNDSKLVLFGGSNNSVSNGGVLSLHGITNSSGNYTDLSAGAGGYIQFRSGTSEKFRITAGGEVLVGITTTGTDPSPTPCFHAGAMMRVSNFYVGRVHGSANNGNAAIVLHKLGQNQGFQMSGSMTFHSYTGSAYLSGSIVARYNTDAVTRDVSLQKAQSGMNLQLVTGTISGVSGNYLAIKKNGGGTGVCYINGFYATNMESYGGIREVANGDWTTTTVHGSGITGSNDSASS